MNAKIERMERKLERLKDKQDDICENIMELEDGLDELYEDESEDF